LITVKSGLTRTRIRSPNLDLYRPSRTNPGTRSEFSTRPSAPTIHVQIARSRILIVILNVIRRHKLCLLQVRFR